jgi:N-acetyl-anhydromuramyl-L-alanine amidase AmpD
VGEEPILEPTTPGVRDNDHSNGARGEPSNGPALEPPARSSARPAPRSHAPLRRATLRRNVQAYVNEPADLFTPPRADRPWRYIVLHHSAHASGSLRQIDRDHRERLGTAGCGYHFVIGNGSDSPDGQVEVATRWSKQEAGQHCRDSRVADINDYGIGICLVGNLDASPPTPRQVEAAKALISYLQDRYGIASVNVVTHDLIARTATACPGKHFPTQALLGHDRNLTAR